MTGAAEPLDVAKLEPPDDHELHLGREAHQPAAPRPGPASLRGGGGPRRWRRRLSQLQRRRGLRVVVAVAAAQPGVRIAVIVGGRVRRVGLAGREAVEVVHDEAPDLPAQPLHTPPEDAEAENGADIHICEAAPGGGERPEAGKPRPVAGARPGVFASDPGPLGRA